MILVMTINFLQQQMSAEKDLLTAFFHKKTAFYVLIFMNRAKSPERRGTYLLQAHRCFMGLFFWQVKGSRQSLVSLPL